MYQNIFYENDKGLMHLWDDEAGYSQFKYKRYGYISDDKGVFVSMTGKKVKRIGRWSDADMEAGLIHEGDINPEMRVLIDNYLESDEHSKNHKQFIFDIEVSTEDNLPDIALALNEITAITYYVNTENKYKALILDKRGGINRSSKDDVEVIPYSTEKDLLTAFLSAYTTINPTIISGWNIDYFDIPYLFNRLKRVLGENMACLLSPIGIVKWMPYRERYRLAGISCLDYLALYKKFTFSQEPSYSLDAISKKELGMGKVSYEVSLNDLYENDLQKFIEYSITDVKLVKMIDEKMKLVELTKGICHKGHVPYEDVYYSSKFLEGAMLVYMKKLNMVAPPKKNKESFGDVDKFEGAYVKAPIPGKYDWVYDLDMTSLYPSVIMTLNISPETKVGKIDGWNSDDYIKNVEKTHTLHVGNKTSSITNLQLKELLEEGKFSISSNGILYSTDKKGIIPAILEQWYAERVEYRALMKKYGDSGNEKMYEYFTVRQYIQKVLLNSLYGVLGLPIFRFYDVDNAEATTITGQKIIQYSEKMANYYYNKELNTNKDYVIYVDTDSNYISALPLIKHRYPNYNNETEEQIAKYVIEIATDAQKFINSSFDLFAKRFLNITGKHHFNIKQELVAKSGIWLSKKRYAMWTINDNGVKVEKMVVKGIDVVRADFPPAFRTLLKEMLKDILFDATKEKIDEKLLTFKKKISILSIIDVAKPTSVKNVRKYTSKRKKNVYVQDTDVEFKNYEKGSPAHVKASIMYNNLIKYYRLEKKYKRIEDGEKIRWVYLTQNQFGIDAVAFKGYDDPPQIMEFITNHADKRKMFDSVLLEKIEDLYSSMNWILELDSKSKINDFFN